MYLDHFELSDYPFIQSARDELYFCTEDSRRHTATIQHWLESGHGMLVIAGTQGTGRSSLAQHAISTSELDVDSVVISDLTLNKLELLQYIALEIGIKTSTSDWMLLRHAIKHHLKTKARAERRFCLIIREAQRLEAEQLALLTDLSTDHTLYLPLCLIVLTGDAAFGRSVQKTIRNEQSQRFARSISVSELKENATRDYITHRLALVAGNGANPFSPTVIRQIHEQTDGNLTAINILCDQVLVRCAIDGVDTVSHKQLRAAIRQLGWSAKFKSGSKSAAQKSESSRPVEAPKGKTMQPAREAPKEQTLQPAPEAPGALERSVHQLIREVTTIGRAADCSIRINQQDISPYQALIVKTDDGMFIRNEGRDAALYLNSARIDTANLHDGDTVKIGNYELSLSTDVNGMVTLTAMPPLV